ncbi:MAG TPA: GNAT family N-acetyltransferase [Porphyromonadaceae bacterium]|nr:GNAT family N-acetyltransferase [Porphyromonadaceae bacterium]
MEEKIKVMRAKPEHVSYVDIILKTIEEASKIRGTGIARRNPEYVKQKIMEGKAILALTESGVFAGFCYVETWSDKKFVVHSGLIVDEKFRGIGLAKAIKKSAFDLCRERYPQSCIFGLTTGAAVMRINHELGYRAVTFAELTSDDDFWKGCSTCVNHEILVHAKRRFCMCTAMLFDPNEKKKDVMEGINLDRIEFVS